MTSVSPSYLSTTNYFLKKFGINPTLFDIDRLDNNFYQARTQLYVRACRHTIRRSMPEKFRCGIDNVGFFDLTALCVAAFIVAGHAVANQLAQVHHGNAFFFF